ncbi:MAG: hypothetical protein QM831_16465 [Kofleriaceae bacterium]
MRTLAFVVLASCGTSGQTFKPAPLPELVKAQPADQRITAHEMLLVPGEQLIYEVHLHGITVGKLEMDVSETEVTSKFATDSVAAAFASVHHDLSTTLDRPNARAVAGLEQFVMGDQTKNFQYDGKNGQTIHTTLGLLRGWVASDATPGFVDVQELGHKYRMVVKRPLVEDLAGTKAFRVDTTVNTKEPLTIQIWFDTADGHKPLRFDVVNDDFHITANLIQT